MVIEDDAVVGTKVEVEAAAVAGVFDLEALRDTLLRSRAFRRSLEEREWHRGKKHMFRDLLHAGPRGRMQQQRMERAYERAISVFICA